MFVYQLIFYLQRIHLLDKITKSLTFSNEKAIRELGWKPMNVLENFRIE